MRKRNIIVATCVVTGGVLFLVLGLMRGWLGAPVQTEGSASQSSQAVPGVQQPCVDEFAPGKYSACERQANEYLQPVPQQRPPQELTVICPLAAKPPCIDGKDEDDVWSAAEPVVTLDFLSQRPITLKSVHTSDSIFFLAKYPDSAPSTTHKSYRWDETERVYKPMGDREDALTFRWSMNGMEADLLLRHGQPHAVDVWFWKAWRTNPVGYADDKWETLTDVSGSDAQKIEVPGRPAMYLRREGDQGQPACQEKLVVEYEGPFASRFSHNLPDGSRADVQAKGIWRDGVWTIEFSRKLDTGQTDDLAFKPEGVYLFVVSCYETAGSGVNPSFSQPLYNAGDGFDRLILKIVSEEGER